jgi:hypothetical protein
MDAPPIQYAKTADGVNIAFWAIGQGPPLVMLPRTITSNPQVEWELDSRRATYERLAERARIIAPIGVGSGLATRLP